MLKRSAVACLKGEGEVGIPHKLTKTNDSAQSSPLQSFFIVSKTNTEEIEGLIEKQLAAREQPLRKEGIDHELPAAPYVCVFLTIGDLASLTTTNKYFHHHIITYVLPRFTIQMILNRTSTSQRLQYSALHKKNIISDQTEINLPSNPPTKYQMKEHYDAHKTPKDYVEGK